MQPAQQQQQQLLDQKRFEELVQDAKDFDPDKKFMAANDLSNALSNGQLKDTDYDTVVKILLNQLNDDSNEVQGNSIRCLSKIINKLQETQVENVSKTMIVKVIEDKGEYRDVYATCLKTLINGVPSNYAKAVQPILLHAIQGMEQKLNNKEFDVQEELCDILNNLFKKWGQSLSTTNANVKNLTNILMSNISKGERNSLKKKSCSCLGSLGLILHKDDIGRVVKELLQHIKKPDNQKQIQQHLREKQIYVVYALSAISKTVAKKLGSNLKDLINIILNDINQYVEEVDDYDLIITISEMFESYLSILESLIKGCPDEIKEYFSQIVDLSSQLINYDPNGQARISNGGEMEIEEGGEDDEYDYLSDDQDGDDSSWRVRRAALNIIETLVKSDSEMIRPIFEKCVSSQSEQSTIVYRLGERNENIRFATFSCLQTIIRAIVISDVSHDKVDDDFDQELNSGPQLVRVKSAVKEFNISEIISEIFNTLTFILEKEKKVTQAILTGAYKLIESISRNLSRQVVSDPSIWRLAFDLIKRTIENKSSPNELKVTAFSSLRKLLKNYHESSEIAHLQNDIPNIFKLASVGLVQDYFKIVAESFRCLNSLFNMINKQFNSAIPSFSSSIQQIFPQISVKLNSSDIDQEIKQSVLSCTTSLLVSLPQTIQAQQLKDIINAISEKIKSETKKISVLKLLKKIPISVHPHITADSIKLLNSSAESICDLLAKQDRSLRVACLEALDKTLVLLSEKKSPLSAKARDNFTSLAYDFLNDKDTWVAQLYLLVLKKSIENSPQSPQYYTKVIESITKFSNSSIVSSAHFNSLYEVFSTLSKLNLSNRSQMIQNLIATGSKDSINSVSRAISSIITELPAAEQQTFINQIFTTASSDKEVVLKRQICLVTLGEIGRHVNLCKGNILQEVQKILNNKQNNEEIRTAASISLGGIAIGNLDMVLPQVIQTINSGSEGQYLMLNSLKQIIEHSQQLSQSIIQIIPNLFKATENGDESLCNIISYIIGKVTHLNLKEMKPLILQNLSSKNQNTKYTTASSFKYFCLKTLKIDNDLRELVYALLNNITEKDIRTRTAILKSLNMISYNLPNAIIQHINKNEFFLPVREALRFTQIREIDFGPFKQKNDDGEPVRNAAFTLLDTAIDHLHYRGVENFEREILEEVLYEFATESSEDIKILRFQICTKFAHKVPLKVTPFLDQISEVFLNVLKPYASKADGDRAADMVRTGLICCLTLKTIAEDESNTKYLNFWELVMKTEKYRNIINSMTN
ncbi:hypothetical protein ABPG74_010558 [Tetrahymena malaccensis]